MAYGLLPLVPFLFGFIFLKPKLILQYRLTLKKYLIYIKELKNGPIEHYLKDVISHKNVIPATIEGSCIKCGNCCLDKKCIFLEQSSENEYICGIYTSPLRRFSNCNSFPLNARDIQRYSCPSFTEVIAEKTENTFVKPEYKTNWIRSVS